MTTLTVTSKGQVTLRKDVLKHLGIKPGEKLEIDLLPNGRAEVKAAQPAGSIDDFIGLLADQADRALTVEEMSEIAAAGWAGSK